MAREVEHRVVAARFVAVCVGDHGLRIVRHGHLRDVTDERQRTRYGLKPVLHRLGWRRAGKGVAGGAQGGYGDVSTDAMGETNGGPGVIDEQHFASAVHLAHRALELLSEATSDAIHLLSYAY